MVMVQVVARASQPVNDPAVEAERNGIVAALQKTRCGPIKLLKPLRLL